MQHHLRSLLIIAMTFLPHIQASPITSEAQPDTSHVDLLLWAPVGEDAKSMLTAHWGEHTDWVVQSEKDFADPDKKMDGDGRKFELVGDLKFQHIPTEDRLFKVFFKPGTDDTTGADVSV